MTHTKKYILSMIGDYAEWGTMSAEENEAFDRRINSFNDELQKAGALVHSEGLGEPSAGRTVRFADGNASVSDGPYAESPDQLGAFWLIEVASIDDAVEWARKVQLTNGAIEVRALV